MAGWNLWVWSQCIGVMYRSMDDNFGEWVESMGVASGRG